MNEQVVAPGPGAATLTAAAAAVREGRISSTALTQSAVAAADRLDAELGVFLTRLDATALVAADAADGARAGGQRLGALHGLPLGVKDMIATAEAPTTAQTLVLAPGWGAGADAPVVARLRRSGAIIMGKTALAELGMGLPDATQPFPLPRNPWNPVHWAGGSSSGSASGVAAGIFLGALGTDTAGSIRHPAAFCGITGFKPTYGLVPKAGVVPLAHTLDTVGPMARTAEDCALILSVIAGAHADDPASVDVGPRLALPDLDTRRLRIGVDDLSRIAGTEADPAVSEHLAAAIEVLRGLGATVTSVELPMYEQLTTATYVTLHAEAQAYHAHALEERWHTFSASTRTLLARGSFYTGADYVQAQRVRQAGQRAVALALEHVDVLLTPTMSIGAPQLEDLARLLDAEGFRTGHTAYWNAVGNPALSVPMGFTGAGLPVGLQIAGRAFDDATVLAVGVAYQRSTDWHLRYPLVGAAGDGRPRIQARSPTVEAAGVHAKTYCAARAAVRRLYDMDAVAEVSPTPIFRAAARPSGVEMRP